MSVAVLEKKLAGLFGYDHALMLGRARAGLVALIEIFQDQTAAALPVMLPENICSVVVTAIRAGGGRAVTVPVSPVTGLVADQDFVRAMQRCDRPGIVMPAHLYGFVGDYPATIKYARNNGWFIVENDTNAIRMTAGSTPFGDALLVSFGYAKPIEIGSGGAILTNDPTLARTVRTRVADYDIPDSAARTLEQQTMLERRALRPGLDPASARLRQICDLELDLCRFRFDDSVTDRLLAKIDHFPEESARRTGQRDLWDRLLAPLDDILQPVAVRQPVPWRLIRRVAPGRDYFTHILWNHDIDAGINYRSLWRELPPDYLTGEPTGPDRWGDSVLNLWLTADYDCVRMEKTARILMEAANEI